MFRRNLSLAVMPFLPTNRARFTSLWKENAFGALIGVKFAPNWSDPQHYQLQCFALNLDANCMTGSNVASQLL